MTDVDSDIERHESFSNQDMPVSAIKESKKRLARNYFSDLEPEEVDKILEDIDKQADDSINSGKNKTGDGSGGG